MALLVVLFPGWGLGFLSNFFLKPKPFFNQRQDIISQMDYLDPTCNAKFLHIAKINTVHFYTFEKKNAGGLYVLT